MTLSVLLTVSHTVSQQMLKCLEVGLVHFCVFAATDDSFHTDSLVFHCEYKNID